MRVQLFIPCFVDQLFPTTAFNTIKVLEKAGCTVSYNPTQTCCGQPAFNAGYRGAVTKNSGTEVLRGIEALLRREPYFYADDGSALTAKVGL